jgi:hypothetical protein
VDLHRRVGELLLEAYQPCKGFATACDTMRWEPTSGHVPRGFCGATGDLREVELVMVCAEPGDPHTQESHLGASPVEQLQSAYAYAYTCFRDGKDLFHRNIRHILDTCFPSQRFDHQLRRVWITDSVKCSARKEGGSVPAAVARECRDRFLMRELALFPDAVVVALGKKAAVRLVGVPEVVCVGAAAPPYGPPRRPAKRGLGLLRRYGPDVPHKRRPRRTGARNGTSDSSMGPGHGT